MEYVKNVIKEAEELGKRCVELIAENLVTRIKVGVLPEKIEDAEFVFVFKGLPADVIRGILRFSFDDEAFIAKVIELFPEIEEELDIESSYSYMELVYADDLRSEVEDAAIMIHIPLLMKRVEWDPSQITGDVNESAVTTSMSINVQTDKDGSFASMLAARAGSTY